MTYALGMTIVSLATRDSEHRGLRAVRVREARGGMRVAACALLMACTRRDEPVAKGDPVQVVAEAAVTPDPSPPVVPPDPPTLAAPPHHSLNHHPTFMYIPSEPIPANPIDKAAAKQALVDADARAAKCRPLPGPGKIQVTFDPKGAASAVKLLAGSYPPAVETCLVSAFATAKVPPFGDKPAAFSWSLKP